MRKYIGIAGFIVTAIFNSGVAAQQRNPISQMPAAPGLTFSESWRPAYGKGETRVIGMVLDVRQVRVARARVQLRDLNSGTVAQQTDTNDDGEYVFEVSQPGTFVVEMVQINGYILGLSNAGSLARFETLQTVVQLAGRWDSAGRNVVLLQNVSDFFGMSSAMTMTAATLGLAVDQSVAPVDSGEAVSPY